MPILESLLTCPHCGASTLESMALDACIVLHECASCGERLRPRAGDCCVFCSYGSVRCPPVQLEQACCGPRGTVAKTAPM